MAKKKPARTSTGKGKAAKTVSKSKKKSSAVAKTKKPKKAKSSSPKKTSSTSKSVASKKKSSKLSAVKKGKGSNAAKRSKAKTARTKSQKKSPSKPLARSVAPSHKPTTGSRLSAQDRYNAGGLLTCAIDRDGDPGSRKLRKVLKLLQLSNQEQENLVRLSQGFTIPKLFSDELSDEGIRKLVVKEVVNSVKGEGNYERDWQEDLRLFAGWLGVTI